jgi:hypothetical protein
LIGHLGFRRWIVTRVVDDIASGVWTRSEGRVTRLPTDRELVWRALDGLQAERARRVRERAASRREASVAPTPDVQDREEAERLHLALTPLVRGGRRADLEAVAARFLVGPGAPSGAPPVKVPARTLRRRIARGLAALHAALEAAGLDAPAIASSPRALGVLGAALARLLWDGRRPPRDERT